MYMAGSSLLSLPSANQMHLVSGMPPEENQYDHTLANASYNLAKAWHTCDVMGIGADPPPVSSRFDIPRSLLFFPFLPVSLPPSSSLSCGLQVSLSGP